MGTDLDKIRGPVEDQMTAYDDYMRRMLESALPEVDHMARYVFSKRGKAVRPLVVMLSAGLFPDSGAARERSRLGSMIIEMIHTASLIHDDIVDESFIRRGAPSVNALWGDHKAVLIGDYIIARAFAEGMASGHYDVVRCVSDSMYGICEGELLQSYQSDRLDMTREIYTDIIRKKTGLLLGAASAAGAIAADAPAQDVAQMRSYGENLGLAFQMRDDVLDYAPASQTGKPTCGDLRERKINLPLLMVLESAPEAERRVLLKKLSDVRRNPPNVDYLHAAVVSGGGIEAASELMDQHLEAARAALAPYEASPCRTSLYSLCDYIATRDR